jgi:hypothetical protein
MADRCQLHCPTCIAYLKEVLDGLEALDYRRTYQQFYDFRPYAKQRNS